MPKRTLAIFTALAAVAAVLSFLWLDTLAAEAAYGVRETWIHGLARRLGRAGEIHWYLVPPILLGLFWRKQQPARARKAWFMAAAVSGAGLIALSLKAIIGRTRPLLLMEDGVHDILLFQFEYDHMAFPSGHATTAFAAMTALAVLFPKALVPLFGVAVILAGARVVSLSHYLSDVVAGAWIGTVAALFIAIRMLPEGPQGKLP